MSKQKSRAAQAPTTAQQRAVTLEIDGVEFEFATTRKDIFNIQQAVSQGGDDSFAEIHNFLLKAVAEPQEQALLAILDDPANMTIHQEILMKILPALAKNGVSLGEARAKANA